MSNARWNIYSTEEARRSRFEEGVPTDPTQNMDPADSKKWKEMHDEHKDNFKSAFDKEVLERYQLEIDTSIVALKLARKTPKNPKKHFFSALHSIGMALGQLEPEGQGPASEAVLHAAQKVNMLRPATDFAKSAADLPDNRFIQMVETIRDNADAMLTQVKRFGGLEAAVRSGHAATLQGQLQEISSTSRVLERRMPK